MRLTLLIGSIAALICASADTANAQACIRDDYGRVLCGEPVSPYRQHGYAPRRNYDDGYYDRGYRGGYYGYSYPRPNTPTAQYPCQPGWTVQSGHCKPYRGY